MKHNLIIRTLTGVVFVALLFFCIVYNASTFLLLFAIISGMTTWEFCTLMNRHAGVRLNCFIAVVASVILFLAFSGISMRQAYFEQSPGFSIREAFLPYILTLIYVFVSELYTKSPTPLQNIASFMLAQIYVALPFALMPLLVFRELTSPFGDSSIVAYEGSYLLSIFAFLWLSDTGAYCAGSLFGKHRLFPRISPKKSWEGSIGGFVLALLASQLFPSLGFHFVEVGEHPLISRLLWAGLAAVVVVFGTWGDLVESLFKRQMGIKDSGRILPGHGGMLDRFDSALLAIPASVIYIQLCQSAFH